MSADDPRLTEARAVYETLPLATDPVALAYRDLVGAALVAHHNAEAAMRRAIGDAAEAVAAWKAASVPLAEMPPATFEGTPLEQIAAAEAGLAAVWPLFEADVVRNAEAARRWLLAVTKVCHRYGLAPSREACKRMAMFIALAGT